MDRDLHQRARAVFEALLETDEADRPAALERLCGGDPRLEREVASLLEHDGRPRIDLDAPPAAGPPADAPSVERIGRFRVTGVLGAGGMGVVYRAESTHPARTVAIKLIRADAAGPGAVRRFDLESDALARLQHPGIAQIFESGTAEIPGLVGPQPFIAMELVDGEPLVAAANRRGLDVADRAALMMQVCEAIEHAHRRGVIHRDLKPGNVLVTAEGRPKVLDFGVARLVDADTLATMRTAPGQIVGTLPYLSPEQLSGDPADVDTRCDVYALGVMLFELLAGELPHDVRHCPLPEAVHRLRDTDPRTLSSVDRRLRGDLDTIVQRALEREPARRYPSAAALGEDLRRFLADEPILARRPGTVYQFRKLARRHRAIVAGLAAVFLTLVAGIIGTGLALAQSRRHADDLRAALAATDLEARKANEVVAFIRDTFAGIDPVHARGEEVTLREALEQASARVAPLLDDGEPEIAASIRETIGEAFKALGHHDLARPHLERSLEQRLATLGPDDRLTARSRVELAELDIAVGALDAARARLDRALATPAAALPEDDAIRMRAQRDLGRAALAGQDFERAEAHLRTAIEAMERHGAPGATELETCRNDLALVLAQQGRLDEAEPLMREVLASRRERFGDAPHAYLVPPLTNLAMLLRRTNRPEEALPCLIESIEIARAVYGEHHPRLETALNNLGTLQRSLGDLPAAEAAYREALEIARGMEGDGGPGLAMRMQNLASLQHAVGRLDEAEAMYADALAELAARDLLGSPHHSTVLVNAARLDRDRGHDDVAEARLREAVAIRRARLAGHPRLAYALCDLGRLLLETDRAAEAEPLFREAQAVLDARLDPDDLLRSIPLGGLGEALVALDRPAEAIEPLQAATALRRAAPDADRDLLVGGVVALARALAAVGRPDEARALTASVIADLDAGNDADAIAALEAARP